MLSGLFFISCNPTFSRFSVCYQVCFSCLAMPFYSGFLYAIRSVFHVLQCHSIQVFCMLSGLFFMSCNAILFRFSVCYQVCFSCLAMPFYSGFLYAIRSVFHVLQCHSIQVFCMLSGLFFMSCNAILFRFSVCYQVCFSCLAMPFYSGFLYAN